MAQSAILGMLFGWLIALTLSFVITYYLIKAAIKSANKKQVAFTEAQLRILIEIARRQGVEEDKITSIQERLN